MTYGRERQAQRGRPMGRPRASLLAAYVLDFESALDRLGLTGSVRWPNETYRNDPELFFREVLGIEPWGDDTHGQVALLQLVRDHDRVAVRAGRKVSKSLTLAGLALWWFACWPDAQVVMCSTTAHQVDDILWREVRTLHGRSQNPIPRDDKGLLRNPALCTKPLDGEPMSLARSGLRSGLRDIQGVSSREAEAAQGKSGVHLLYLLDEASGIKQQIIDAILGNLAASGSKLVLAGNPTRSEGEFYDAFNSKKATPEHPRGYHCLTISSEESPNVVLRAEVIPGMAGIDWIHDREYEWGRDSPMFRVHVLGQHVELEQGKIIPLSMIAEAQERWSATGEEAVPALGVLHIGIDPGFGQSGDEAGFCIRRGKRVLDISGFRTMTNEAMHVAHLDAILREHRLPTEVAIVNLDSLGDVGSKVSLALRAYQQAHPKDLVVNLIRGSDNAIRDPAGYIRVRDELWGMAAQWLRDGGAIPEDIKLTKDLHSPSWLTSDLKLRKQATKKDDLRHQLGRSPDRGDAFCLACWDCSKQAANALADAREPQDRRRVPRGWEYEPAAYGMDPYAGADFWQSVYEKDKGR